MQSNFEITTDNSTPIMKLNIVNLLVLLLCPIYTAVAQNAINMKFGKPTKAEMQMTTYEAEPDADAVVLCRLTDVEYTIQQTGYLVDYKEKVRIKVLKPEGARFAKVVIPYLKSTPIDNSNSSSKLVLKVSATENNSVSSSFDEQAGAMTTSDLDRYSEESIEDLKATAYNLKGSKVVKSALKKGDIAETKIDDQHYQVEFTIPDVQEGTVIEYEYTLHSELFWLLHDWFAQREIPVAYAKLDMNIPRYLLFELEEHGIQRLISTCESGSMRYKLESDPLAAPTIVPSNHYICVGRNLKSVKPGDGVWSMQDNCAGISAYVKHYSMRGAAVVDCSTTWENIDEKILKSEDLGKQLDDHSPLLQQLKDAGERDCRPASACRRCREAGDGSGAVERALRAESCRRRRDAEEPRRFECGHQHAAVAGTERCRTQGRPRPAEDTRPGSADDRLCRHQEVHHLHRGCGDAEG